MTSRSLQLIAAPLLLIALAGLGCRSVHHAYPGEERALSEVAALRAVKGKVVELNGESVFAAEVRVPPGAHDIVALFYLTGDEIAPNVKDERIFKLTCPFELEARAGHRYRIEAEEPSRHDRRGSQTSYTYSARLVDMTKEHLLARITACYWS